MNLGVQYYRPPFPVDKHWEKDFNLIKDSGLDTVQLWLVWAWIESKPGIFNFGDYDRLVELADKKGLQVVLSTIAEVHPYWIHKEVPGSEMVDHMGRTVISSNRCEIHFGITPGGCFDHPGVWERMKRFLTETTVHYRSAPNLAGWDCWNELRWSVQSDGLVCFCPHTLKRFRGWLAQSYGGLDGLNRAWMRRYNSFEEIMPGKLAGRPYTEMMAWERFITWRSDEHGRMRYETMKPLDPGRDVTAHGGTPTPLDPGGGGLNPAGASPAAPGARGNDWALADRLDGVGTSSFPKWFGLDEAAFGMRIEMVKSAAQGKKVWLSEIQGGRSAVGFEVFAPVDAASQQRWIWTGIACGADKLIFWCWRDEVFGSESAGFGIIGADGLAEERLAALKKTRALIEKNRNLLDHYKPDLDAEAAALFSPESHYLAFAQEGTAKRIIQGLSGYLRALTRLSIPYRVVDPDHLQTGLKGVKILFLPRVIVTSPETGEKLARFVKEGGTLVCESECGAFSPEGIYKYPDERFLAKLTGVRELGRRSLKTPLVTVTKKLKLNASQWLTPFEDNSLMAEARCGKGKVVFLGSYFGNPYLEKWDRNFETLVGSFCAGAKRNAQVTLPLSTKDCFVYVKTGESKGRKVVFLFFPEKVKKATLLLKTGFLRKPLMKELFSGRTIRFLKKGAGLEAVVTPDSLKIAILTEEKS